ncbi:MAG TPA: lamin tail domain-containing protein, partial [Planctomycetota bacterium]|nr:lamin tail domain-containing protein [Planctomycetota bacterium]
GMTPTNVDTQTYIFVDRVLTQTRPSGYPSGFDFDMDQTIVNDGRYQGRIRNDLRSLPSISVVMSVDDMFGGNGLMTAPASSVEKPGSVEIIYPDGRDGSQADCGFKPHSHVLRKRSFRLYFRESQYGVGRWKHDLFNNAVEGVDARSARFDVLVLRAGVNDNLQSNYDGRAGRATYVADQLARSSQAAMSGYGQRGLFAHLYVNGLYWGLYNLAERPDDAFSASQFGGNEDDWFAANHGGELSGDPSWFLGLVNNAGSWSTAQQRLDLAAFADYILYYSFSGGGDWPGNNWYVGNRFLPAPGKIRFYIWDCEDSWIRMPGRANDGAWLHPDLIAGTSFISRIWQGVDNHADFLMLFADRVYKHCFNDGVLTDEAIQARFDRLCAEISGAVVGESARWGRYKGGGGRWTRDDDWVPYVNSVRSLMSGNVQRLISALRNTNVPAPHPKYYPDVDPPLFKSNGATLRSTWLTVLPGFPLTIERAGSAGTVYCTVDGSDPRAPGGAPRGTPVGSGLSLTVTTPLHVQARTLHNGEWSALHTLVLDVVPTLPVEIHEFMAENDEGAQDERGEREDWIEIWNRSSQPFHIGGYHLTDNLNNPTKWRFPSGTTIPANSTILVWADSQPNQGPLHTNFGLSTDGEVVALFDPSGTVLLDGCSFGPQEADVSIGRLTTGGGWYAFSSPTPGRPNRPSPAGHVTYRAANLGPIAATLRGEGTMMPGEYMTLRLDDAQPSRPVLFMIGVQPLSIDFGALGSALVLPIATLPGATDADGKAVFSLPLPLGDAALRDLSIYTQAIVGGAGGGLTEAVLSRFCP